MSDVIIIGAVQVCKGGTNTLSWNSGNGFDVHGTVHR